MEKRQWSSTPQVRQDILDVAEELFCAKGYTATKVSEIRGAGPRGTGSLYHQFGDKPGIFMAVISRMLDDIVAGIDKRDPIRTLLQGVYRKRNLVQALASGDGPPGYGFRAYFKEPILNWLGNRDHTSRLVMAIILESAVLAAECQSPEEVDDLAVSTSKLVIVTRTMGV